MASGNGRSTKVCSGCGKARQLRSFTSPLGRVCKPCQRKTRSDTNHRRRVANTYGLKEGDYDTLSAAQGGACAICRGTRRQRLSVDHDHRTGLVRGLLCRMCNGRLLTAARDDPSVLRAAAAYLESPPALRVVGRRYAADAPPLP